MEQGSNTTLGEFDSPVAAAAVAAATIHKAQRFGIRKWRDRFITQSLVSRRVNIFIVFECWVFFCHGARCAFFLVCVVLRVMGGVTDGRWSEEERNSMDSFLSTLNTQEQLVRTSWSRLMATWLLSETKSTCCRISHRIVECLRCDTIYYCDLSG